MPITHNLKPITHNLKPYNHKPVKPQNNLQ